jgi:hypothetical protein
MHDLNWAWDLLSDPRRRAEWDRSHAGPRSAGHWSTDRGNGARPDVNVRPEGWNSRPNWTVSGEAWAGAGAPTVERLGVIGCIGLTLIAIAVFGFVLFGAFLTGYQSPTTEPAQQSEAASESPAEP